MFAVKRLKMHRLVPKKQELSTLNVNIAETEKPYSNPRMCCLTCTSLFHSYQKSSSFVSLFQGKCVVFSYLKSGTQNKVWESEQRINGVSISGRVWCSET
jgi:hypothetical protein